MAGRISGKLSALGITLSVEHTREISLLDQEFLSMQNEITALQAQKTRLAAQVNPLERDVQRLQKQVDKNKPLKLSELENKILRLLCDFEEHLYLKQIAVTLKENEIKTEVALNDLEDRSLVEQIHPWQGGVIYKLSDDGKRYVVDQGWTD